MNLKTMRQFLAYLICLYLFAGTAQLFAAEISDIQLSVKATKITDGDSLRSGNIRLRLYGIDAPEIRQQCQDKSSQPYRCGSMAKQYLSSIALQDRLLDCVLKDIDRYKRLIVQCRADGKDIATQMVRAGWAVAYRRYSSDYIDDEAYAKSSQQGIWQGSFTMPEAWRHKN